MRADDIDSFRPSAVGHNGGPPLESGVLWRRVCWRQAHREAWRTPPREVLLRRLARARELGMSYRDYMLVVLDTGRLP